jgi:hypothetical protein
MCKYTVHLSVHHEPMENILTQWKATASQNIKFYFGLSGLKQYLPAD